MRTYRDQYGTIHVDSDAAPVWTMPVCERCGNDCTSIVRLCNRCAAEDLAEESDYEDEE